MKTSKKNLVKSGRGNLKNPSPPLVKTTIKPSGSPLRSPSGQTTVRGSCSSAVSVPNCVVPKSGSCPKLSSKRSATKTPFRSDHSNWFKTVLQLKELVVGFKACHVDKRTFFGVSKTRTCAHLHDTYREAFECSQLMRVGK